MKLCLGCMRQIQDRESACPYCGFDERRNRQEAYYLKPGTVIAGRYIVGKALHYDGFIITYIGWDAKNKCRVSIQEYMSSDFATRVEGDKEVTIYSGDAQEEYMKGFTLFLNEGNAMQKLPGITGIAAVCDCCAENATGYLITEYLSGKTLKDILSTGKRFTFEQAEQLLMPLLQSLSVLHQAGIMHYDIAPQNILLTDDGTARLINFGSARFVTTAKSRSLAVLVKQGYAPEEQYRTHGEKGSWSDVYAIAAVFYHMITGAVPEESIKRGVQDNLKEPSKYGVDIPKSAENALMNALNVYTKDRTKTIQQFCQELKDKNVRRIQVKKKDGEKSWKAKKLVIAALAAAVAAGGAAAVCKTRSTSLHREAEGTYMLSPTKLNEAFTAQEGEQAVISELAELGFQKDKVKFVYEYSPDSEQDRIFETEPSDQVLLTDEILEQEVSVCIGSSKYVSIDSEDMKRLQTKKIGKAKRILKKKYGFQTIQKVDNEDYDDGTVGTVYDIKGNFSSKTSCRETVTIVCARGSRESYEERVPELIGTDYDQYVQTGRIKPVRIDVFGTGWGTVKDGTIVDTSKQAGETIITGGPDGEEFICYVWNQNPDLASLTADNVEQELGKAGIKVQEGEAQYSSSVAQGKLIFDSTKLIESQKEVAVYHKSLGAQPEPVQENQSQELDSSRQPAGNPQQPAGNSQQQPAVNSPAQPKDDPKPEDDHTLEEVLN